jgi:hypothetical protein
MHGGFAQMFATQPVAWQAPPLGTAKVNWDAAMDVKRGWVGVKIIARDCVGHVLATRSTTHLFQVDPTMAEAWAAPHVVIFNKEVSQFDIL